MDEFENTGELRKVFSGEIDLSSENEKSTLMVDEKDILRMADAIRQNRIEDQIFAINLDRFLDNGARSSEYIYVCKTSNALAISGADKELDVVIAPRTIAKCMADPEVRYHGHGLTRDILQRIPEELRNPVMIFKGNKDSSLVVITRLKDNKSRGVMVAISLNEMGKRNEVNRISSVYGKDNINNYIRNQMEYGNLIAVNKKEAKIMLQSAGLQLPLEETYLNFNDSIAYTIQNVKGFEEKINERRKNNMAEIKYPISKTKYSDKEIISAINVVHKIFDTERLSLNVIEHPSEKPFVDELRFNIVGSQGLNLNRIENETFDDLASAINRITLSTDNYDEKLVSLLNSDYFTELLSTIDAATYTDYVHTSFGKYYNTTQDRLKENEEIDELSFLIDVGLETSINKMATKTQVYLPETKYPIKKYDKGGHIIYSETKDGYWQKWTYDKNGNNTYWEDSSGNWGKQEYDSNNNRTYYADSTGKTEQTKQSMKDKLTDAQVKEQNYNFKRFFIETNSCNMVALVDNNDKAFVIHESFNKETTLEMAKNADYQKLDECKTAEDCARVMEMSEKLIIDFKKLMSCAKSYTEFTKDGTAHETYIKDNLLGWVKKGTTETTESDESADNSIHRGR